MCLVLFELLCCQPGRSTSSKQEHEEQRKQGSQAMTIDVATLIANIFAAATNRTNILNKTGSMHHQSVYIIRCLCILIMQT
jgi:hypothetical protein